jgi:hypothetical protein
MTPEARKPRPIRSIGIALAAFRPEPRIFAEQLASIRAQAFPAWLCVITLDSPLEPLREEPALQPFFRDERFVWVENPVPLGHKKNFERAMGLALERQVDAIACSDQDDVWYPGKLQACAEALAAAPPLSLVHSDLHVLGGRDGGQTVWAIERRGVGRARAQHLLVRNVVTGCAMLCDAELVRRYPVIPEEARFHDHWYALAAATHGGVHALPTPLAGYRQHDGNVVGLSRPSAWLELPDSVGVAGVPAKCRATWLQSQALARAAARAGMPLTLWQRLLFLRRLDFGLGLIAMGLRHFQADRALSRRSLARGVGKLLVSLQRSA